MKFRPEADIWPLMDDEQLKALAADIDKQGQLRPISLYRGDILDGRSRWLAITRHCTSGIAPQFEDVDPDSPIEFATGHNEQRRQLTKSQRAMVAARALPFYEAEAHQRRIAGSARGNAAARGLVPRLDQARPIRAAADDAAEAFGTGHAIVEQAKHVLKEGSKRLTAAVESGDLSVAKAYQIVKDYSDRRTQDSVLRSILESKQVTRVKGLTGEVEWYTPRLYLDAAVEVMGAIDLDPASSDTAQEHVKAARHHTMADDGLQQPWSGRVWLNPPYAMPYIRQFVSRIVEAHEAGEIEAGILLTNNATDTSWFHLAAVSCSVLCFTRGRISFLEARGGELLVKKTPTHGQVFFYFGPDTERFSKVFAEHGIVMTAERE